MGAFVFIVVVYFLLEFAFGQEIRGHVEMVCSKAFSLIAILWGGFLLYGHWALG